MGPRNPPALQGWLWEPPDPGLGSLSLQWGRARLWGPRGQRRDSQGTPPCEDKEGLHGDCALGLEVVGSSPAGLSRCWEPEAIACRVAGVVIAQWERLLSEGSCAVLLISVSLNVFFLKLPDLVLD